MTLHLIRHGRTIANEKRLYCGFTDIPLSEGGIKELLELKGTVAYPAADLYIISGLLRTRQTLDVLYNNPPYKIIEKLQEVNFGSFEMRGHEQLKSDSDYRSWIEDIENATPLNGESKPDFTKRVLTGFFDAERLCESKAAASAVIVTHGGVICTIMEFLIPGRKNFYEWQPDCSRGYTVHFENPYSIHYANI